MSVAYAEYTIDIDLHHTNKKYHYHKIYKIHKNNIKFYNGTNIYKKSKKYSNNFLG